MQCGHEVLVFLYFRKKPFEIFVFHYNDYYYLEIRSFEMRWNFFRGVFPSKHNLLDFVSAQLPSPSSFPFKLSSLKKTIAIAGWNPTKKNITDGKTTCRLMRYVSVCFKLWFGLARKSFILLIFFNWILNRWDWIALWERKRKEDGRVMSLRSVIGFGWVVDIVRKLYLGIWEVAWKKAWN